MTVILPETTIAKMQTYYQNNLLAPPAGAIFRARTSHAVITAYKSKKVLFQGSSPEIEANKWQTEGELSPAKKTTAKPVNNYTPANGFFTKSHIGSDESGTGDYFGPITAAAAYVKAEQIGLLKELGIQDSKAITDERIKVLAKQLIALEIPYSLMIIPNRKYNQLQKSGWTQGKMKTMIHYSVISNLLQKIEDASYEGILVDQFCMPNVYINHLKSEQKHLPAKSFFMTKAEHYSIAVAAGSILARYSFIKEIEKLSREVGFTLQKGASKKVDQQIAQLIREKGEHYLTNIAKVHFANTKKAAQYL